jgi:cysteine-rich repeat protein
LEVGEDCDDGNAFNGDGCSITCQLEDLSGGYSGAQFVCTNVVNQVSQSYLENRFVIFTFLHT